MNIWGEELPDVLLTPEQSRFLSAFAARPRIMLDEMWRQLDAVWIATDLDRIRTERGLADYYAHPVWILNGIFTATDPVSAGHRLAIANWLASKGIRRIADFGGGSGWLARAIVEASPDSRVDIIEPYPSAISLHLAQRFPGIRWIDRLGDGYDAVIAQDVLEHVADPVGTAARLVQALRGGGHAIFANCFYPVISCHLPETFHLRHTFDTVMRPIGINFQQRIPGAEHARVYVRKDGSPFPAAGLLQARRRESVARIIGPLLNVAFDTAVGLRWKLAGGQSTRG